MKKIFFASILLISAQSFAAVEFNTATLEGSLSAEVQSRTAPCMKAKKLAKKDALALCGEIDLGVLFTSIETLRLDKNREVILESKAFRFGIIPQTVSCIANLEFSCI